MADPWQTVLDIVTKGGASAVLLLALWGFYKGWWRTRQEVERCEAAILREREITRREQEINDKVLPAIEKLTTAFEQLTDAIKLVLSARQ